MRWADVAPLQRQTDQPICLIGHKQRNIQHIIIQLQIVQRKPYAKFDLIREQFFEFFQAFAGGVGLCFNLNRKNIVLPLDQKIHLIRRIILAPVSGSLPFC